MRGRHRQNVERSRSSLSAFRKSSSSIHFLAELHTADRLSAAVVQRRCAYWVRQLVPIFSPTERAALAPGYRYSMAQMELATDLVFKRTAPLKALFQRACELGALVGGAERTTHLFGRHINHRYQGKLQTVLDQRDTGHPVLRWYYQTSFAKNYTRGDHQSDRILRAETCSNDTRHFLLETLLHPGAFAAERTTRELHTRILARHQLADAEYRLSQLRYDLSKLRIKGLVERVGKSRRYRRTPMGLKLGVLLVKLRTRLHGPLATLVSTSCARRPAHSNSVDSALDHLSTAVGLHHAA